MTFHTLARVASILIVSLALALPARAVSLLRDADMEYALAQVAAPVLKAAGLSASRTKILVVNDSSLNAFVISNDAIYIHSGLISRMDRAAMLQAVIAHEAAHITNGHITRRITNLGNARTAATLGQALAILAAAAGAGEGAAAISLGTQSAAQRNFLSHTRAEETAADQSGARYLRSAGIDLGGMLDVFRLFRGQEVLSASRQDPYVRSHPLSRDRLRTIEGFAAAYGSSATADSATSDYWFARAKGKLTSFTRRPSWTLNRLGESGYRDIALMREAAARHQNSQTRRAIAAIDKAIALRPEDPFLYDLKGQILMETRQFAAAANAHGRAVQLLPNDGLLQAGYGRALLASGNVSAALPALERARRIDFRDGSMLRDLSVAYAKSGQRGMASLITAERYALRGRLEDAGIHAKRATGLLSEGSGPWQRAQDVILASERAEKRKKRR
ncbi:M48 family metalloprotease [uncultured Tateyamaria sp.]|uniref:M48 family metalloprotease n=1 Tax=uncultured Tateyamaria sp. TaxID=455651 RepID=UPI0026051DF8|nr:M48 family metalloprotease [uncultured Tateyamaria sp.]